MNMRRKGFKKKVFIGIILVLLGVLFIFFGARIRGASLSLIFPLLRLQQYIFDTQYSGGEERATIKEKIFEEEIKNSNEEIESLRRLLSMKERIKTEVRAADVLYYGSEFGKEFLLLNQGEQAGINIGDIAVDRNNIVVGTIREVGHDFSKVSLASNEGEVFEVEFLPIHAKGLARGIGARALSIELVPADYIIKRGDFIVLFYGGGERFYISEVAREEPNGGAALKVARSLLLAVPENLHEVLIIDSKNPLKQN